MKRGTLLLVGFNVLLLCLLAWLWVDPQGGWRGTHWQPPAAVKPELGGVSAAMVAREDADVARFMAILDRPLFSPGRRPPPPPKSAAAARADPLDAIHLYGVFSGSEGGGVIVRVEGKTRRVKLSEAIGEWNLKEIRGREVVFSRGDETRVVPLVQAKQAEGAALPRPAFAAPVLPTAPPVVAPPPAPPKTAPTPGAALGTPGAQPAAPTKPTSRFVIGGSQ